MMGSARKGWVFENESECLDFISGGGSLIDHRTTAHQVATGLTEDGELLLLLLLLLLLFTRGPGLGL